jgi:hypothetical protein
VALHPGATATVAVSGANGAVTVTVQQGLVTATVTAPSNSITVNATQRTGSDVLHVTDAAGDAVDVPVRVAQDAGTIPAALTLKVTGSAIDPRWLASQIVSFVTRNLTLQPGAQASIAPIVAPSIPPSGGTIAMNVPVAIAGGSDYFDVGGSASVEVRNVAVDPLSAPTLYYDDDPERVVASGTIYRASVAADSAARLYYYHDGGVDRLDLAVVLTAQAPASVQVIDASAGPNLDVMSVGISVTRSFLLMNPRGEGIVVDLDAGSPYVLHDFALSSKAGVAGSVGLQVLSGGPVTVTVLSVAPGVDPLTMLNAPPVAGDGHHRTGAFAIQNFGTQSLAYVAGGADVKSVFGDRDVTPPNVDPNAAGHDYGDYGVLQTFLFSLVNPTSTPVTAYLYERPLGGIVRSSFLVDGNLEDVGCVRVPVPYQIAAFTLAPGGRYQSTVTTMTDGGSNYPVEIGMTSTPPLPTAPPISSPQGCFPKS